MRGPRLLVATTVVSALVAIVAADASARPHWHGLVVTPALVGPLHLDEARARSVIRFAGRPQARRPNGFLYACSARSGICRAAFVFRTAGPFKGRLVAGDFGFRTGVHTPNGTRVGMSAAAARAREPAAVPVRICGSSALRYPPPRPSPRAPFAGLNIVFGRAKVIAIIVFSTHAKVACAGHGYSIT